MSRHDFTERDIHMALDGELPGEEHADYKAWLDANPEMKARSTRFEADRTRLRNTFAGVLEERAPDRLTRLVTGEASRPVATAPRWRMAAAAAVLLALGVGGGYVAGIGWLRTWKRRPRTNWRRRRSPPTPSMPRNSAMRSR